MLNETFYANDVKNKFPRERRGFCLNKKIQYL